MLRLLRIGDHLQSGAHGVDSCVMREHSHLREAWRLAVRHAREQHLLEVRLLEIGRIGGDAHLSIRQLRLEAYEGATCRRDLAAAATIYLADFAVGRYRDVGAVEDDITLLALVILRRVMHGGQKAGLAAGDHSGKRGDVERATPEQIEGSVERFGDLVAAARDYGNRVVLGETLCAKQSRDGDHGLFVGHCSRVKLLELGLKRREARTHVIHVDALERLVEAVKLRCGWPEWGGCQRSHAEHGAKVIPCHKWRGSGGRAAVGPARSLLCEGSGSWRRYIHRTLQATTTLARLRLVVG
mmetsp:Transcript_28097/g.71852  ORF Transcript_28097/g.71852 Transcript_28097/m.71852 type:complete len:298 (-) Transcript_28097:188-1081(-)